MCGIAGFYGFRDDELIKKFSKELEHRGPDGAGFFINENATLLSRRLAIIDRKGGDQPIYNEDKTIAIVYNGEIYNYEELHDELIKLGHTFRTKSDTEVVIHAYEQWGEKSFDRHNGMFAFALYDIKKNKLLLVRDHFGIKPLHFLVMNASSKLKVLFSSEIKPLIQSGLIDRKVNERVLHRYLKYRVHDNTDETFFEGINRLLPGQYMVIEKNTHAIKSYTTLRKDLENIQPKDKLTAEDIARFRDELFKAIKYRLISEVPVGSCLSGGLDSSTVVAVTNQLLKEKVKEAASVGKIQNTFSAVFPGSSNDEEKYMDELIKKVKHVQSHKVTPSADEFFHKDLTDFIRTQEEPIISSGHYAQYKVMQKAHEFVTVVLDGQGSDEMMAGYLPYYFVYLNQLKKQGRYATYLKEVFSSLDVLSKYSMTKLARSLGFKRDVSPMKVLNDQFKAKFVNEKFVMTSDNLKKRLSEDIFENSVQSLLRYEDRDAMRFSIEGRVPFLDFNLLKYIFSLPDNAIIESGWNKNILRKSVADLLPDVIVKRRNKIGFTTPENEWFLRMKNMIYSIFLSESFANRPYFNQAEVLKAFEEFIQGKNDDSMMFWRILNTELWLREFFDSKPEKKEKKQKEPYEANEGKKIKITVEGKLYSRIPIRTELFKKGDDYASKIAKYTADSINRLIELEKGVIDGKKWFIVVSEKIIAISQGRAYFIWDIKPNFFAKLLSRFVKKTPYGIGLGSPWTMQIAIDEAGLPRILLATIASIATKPFGLKGIFYHIAGESVRSIDGPTEYSLYPSNVSAKLGPKDPEKAAEEIKKTIDLRLKTYDGFEGAVIIDANDLGRNVLGNSTNMDNKLIEQIFHDNPMGQGSEQTPIVIVFSV